MDDTLPIASTNDPRTKGLMENYGGLKALAEREAERAFPAKATIIRPGVPNAMRQLDQRARALASSLPTNRAYLDALRIEHRPATASVRS